MCGSLSVYGGDLAEMAARGGVDGRGGALVRAVSAGRASLSVREIAFGRAVLRALGVHPPIPAMTLGSAPTQQAAQLHVQLTAWGSWGRQPAKE